MKISSLAGTLIAACAFTTTQALAAPILIVNGNGVLTGANAVDVAGTLYNVRFADGSCTSLFNGCTASAFAFTNDAMAKAAAQALLDQVFIDSSAGQFDSAPATIMGCADLIECATFIPYMVIGPNAWAGQATNYYQAFNAADFATSNPFPTVVDTATLARNNYAIFELAPDNADVPEPSSFALMGLALAGLAFTRRRA